MGKRKKKSGYWVYQYLTNSTNKWNAVLSLFKILSLSISRFETRTRILSSKSRSSRRERDFFINISGFETRPRYFLSSLMFRDGTSRKNEPNSHENFRDREFLLCSVCNIWKHVITTYTLWYLQHLNAYFYTEHICKWKSWIWPFLWLNSCCCNSTVITNHHLLKKPSTQWNGKCWKVYRI